MKQNLNIKNNLSHLPFRGLGGRFICILLSLLFSFTLQAQNGEAIVDKAAEAYRKANGITATFVMNNNSPQQGYAEDFIGTIDMKGEKFTLETPDFKIWFDGKTMWSYVEQTEEVNVTSPSGDDLRFTNPAILLADYKKDFTATSKGEGTFKGKKVQKVELTPKTKGDVTRVDLQIEKATGYPVQIAVFTKNGASGTITINEMKTGVNQPDRRFVFNPAEHPDVEIIDLR